MDDYFILELVGSETKTCEFTPLGKNTTSCPGIDISLIDSPGFGYGYGYGYGGADNGMFRYNISLNTSNYIP